MVASIEAVTAIAPASSGPREAVLFDFDGVIVTGSNEAYFPVYHAAFVSVGYRLSPEEERALVLRYWSWPSMHFFQHLFEEDPERARRATDAYREALFTREFFDALRVHPELDAMLGRLQGRGLRLGIVSGASGEMLRRILEHYGLARHFGPVLSGYDFEPQHQKPSPHMLLEACAALGCRPENALYVGDTDSDLEAARRARMPFCAVLTGNLTLQGAKSLGADWVIPGVEALEQVLDFAPAPAPDPSPRV
ncbi:MAG: HAD family hydrolase [Candidatus Wallbacteria bacterium]|nr:HAD family hydrolase [Candidatus Wallbacteria bacterium]